MRTLLPFLGLTLLLAGLPLDADANSGQVRGPSMRLTRINGRAFRKTRVLRLGRLISGNFALEGELPDGVILLDTRPKPVRALDGGAAGMMVIQDGEPLVPMIQWEHPVWNDVGAPEYEARNATMGAALIDQRILLLEDVFGKSTTKPSTFAGWGLTYSPLVLGQSGLALRNQLGKSWDGSTIMVEVDSATMVTMQSDEDGPVLSVRKWLLVPRFEQMLSERLLRTSKLVIEPTDD